MQSAIEFFKKYFHAVVWTACYVFVMWAILHTLFGFDMFSISTWNRVLHAKLHGFGGFVFAILVLAAVPLYIATTTLVVRTGKPLFTIGVPKIIKRAFAPPPPPAPEPQPTDTDTKTKNTLADVYDGISAPEHVPGELRGAFINMRAGVSRPIQSKFAASDISVSQRAPATTDDANDPFPIPTDFDFDDDMPPATDPSPIETMGAAPMFDTVPTFSEITFGNTDTKPTPDPNPTDANPTDIESICEFVRTRYPDAKISGDTIITNDTIIATHTDADFWIADDDKWFATGRTRNSPIAELLQNANGRRMIMYLGETNIMDINTRIAEWQNAGIHVVTNLADIQ